ncbi:hypothetical protein GCM10025886_00990 [Tetragenococcus halophilus subsp. flandriensis]|uniref:ATP-grasp domain-containing protein n=1 Tax=Tetragenococcus halophilus TaxID=51669 RepID=UPI0023E9C7E1|nr:ATP-grasp domain-containing protein [Tetragenococcus halophilus]GMA06948.1 hypothetical protein GCM10025886_00990 [Tetragenococcus halophilus subsp. flandriensis]
MKKILVIGAGFLQTFVIKKAKELGYYVFSVDGNPNAEGFKYSDDYKHVDITDEQTCLEYAKGKYIDGVITAATDFGVLTASYIAQEMGLPGLNYSSAKLVKNKYYVRQCFYEHNIDDTEQSIEITKNTDIVSLSDKIQLPVMVKPCDGSGSRGASKVSKAKELKDACDFAIKNSVTQKAEIETFITGREYGIESFVENGNVHIMSILKKRMTMPPYYAELGHAIPSGLTSEIEEKIKNCVFRAIKTLNINFGAVNMDLIITTNGKIHIVDVGARMGGNLIGSHIIRLGTGVDYLANLIKATVGDVVDLRIIQTPTNVVTRLLTLMPGKVLSLPNMQEISTKYNVEIQHHLHVRDSITEYHTNLDGCGYVVSVADNMSEAFDKAEIAKDAIDAGIIRG